jgi:hypothetical protein
MPVLCRYLTPKLAIAHLFFHQIDRAGLLPQIDQLPAKTPNAFLTHSARLLSCPFGFGEQFWNTELIL